MPGFNGTGPQGMGPMTGGGRGFCSPRGTARGYGSGMRPRGFGYGMGPRGYGFAGYRGNRGFSPVGYPSAGIDNRTELDALREQADMMKRDMAEIERRIQELGKEDK